MTEPKDEFYRPGATRLLAGPFIGELGWELFCWQGRLRWLADHVYRSVYVLSRPGSQFLYEDFAEGVNTQPPGLQQSYLLHDLDVAPANKSLTHYDPTWSPEELSYMHFDRQRFVRLGGEPLDGVGTIDVLIHARARKHRARENCPPEWWLEVADRLRRDGYRIACCGLPGSSFNVAVEDGEDYTGIPLERLATVMRRHCRLMLGTSSGPMHLASLCGLDQVVISSPKNEPRYTRDWNPFGTDSRLAPGGWRPTVDAVVREVRERLALKEIA